MAVTVAVLATELRLTTDASAAPPEPLNGVLARTLRASQAIVSERIRDDAPEAIKDLAVIAVASYVHDRPSAPQGERFANPWRNSGAEQMLSRWISRRAVAIGGPDEADEDGEVEEAGGEPMVLIDATLTSANPISPEARGDGRRAALQVIASDPFAVDIEASFVEDGAAIQWDRICPVTSADIFTGDRRLTLNPLVAYRARLVGGGPVRVVLG